MPPEDRKCDARQVSESHADRSAEASRVTARGGSVLVTGATGLLGSHVAQRLRADGVHVRAMVRPGSRTDFLDGLEVEIVRGDLTDPADCAGGRRRRSHFPLCREGR